MTTKSILWLVAIATLAAVGNGSALADDPAPLPIAVVNMDRIFNTHKPHLDRLAPIRTAAGELDKNIQLRQVELETAVNKLRSSQPGTPESQRLQQQAAKLKMELQQYVQKERGDLQKREANIVLNFYRQVDEEVRKHAKAKGIKLVIRQQDGSLDENQTIQQIAISINRGIIYEDGLDITDDILKALDERAETEKKTR